MSEYVITTEGVGIIKPRNYIRIEHIDNVNAFDYVLKDLATVFHSKAAAEECAETLNDLKDGFIVHTVIAANIEKC